VAIPVTISHFSHRTPLEWTFEYHARLVGKAYVIFVQLWRVIQLRLNPRLLLYTSPYAPVCVGEKTLCDSQLIRQGGETFFAKNSDREPGEAQLVCYIPAVENDTSIEFRATYLTIPQVSRRHGLVLSKPAWMWGAEMGVNDSGVVIGNEAIFGKLVDKKGEALLGMDLVRLGLERGDSAEQALKCITQLLETHGQGGPAGYRDKSFRYDNSFIIADASEAWVLETAGRHWVAKQIDSYGAISNALSIEEDFDLCSSGLVDFARKNRFYNGEGNFNFARAFDTRFMKTMACAEHRRNASLATLAGISANESMSFSSLAASLRDRHISTLPVPFPAGMVSRA